jgi:hypothetical protein
MCSKLKRSFVSLVESAISRGVSPLTSCSVTCWFASGALSCVPFTTTPLIVASARVAARTLCPNPVKKIAVASSARTPSAHERLRLM